MAQLFLFPRTRVASEKMIVLLKNLGENSKSTFEIHFSFFYSLFFILARLCVCVCAVFVYEFKIETRSIFYGSLLVHHHGVYIVYSVQHTELVTVYKDLMP